MNIFKGDKIKILKDGAACAEVKAGEILVVTRVVLGGRYGAGTSFEATASNGRVWNFNTAEHGIDFELDKGVLISGGAGGGESPLRTPVVEKYVPTRREYFIAAALQSSAIDNVAGNAETYITNVAAKAIKLADSIIAQIDKTK